MRHLILNIYTEAETGPFLASVALTRDLLDNLQQQVEYFRRACTVYPSLVSTETFDYPLEYYEESPRRITWQGIRRDRREGYGGEEETQLADALFDYDYATSLIAMMDATPDGKFCFVDANKIPASGGNVRTECNSLHLSHASPGGDTVELWWTCLLKNTSCELCTATITSKDLEEWSAKLATESK